MYEAPRTLAFYPPAPWELPENGYDRVRFGVEFCATLMPAVEQLLQAMHKARRAGLEVELVTAYTPQPLMPWMMELLDQVLQEFGDLDLVVNDWGIYQAARAMGYQRFVLGRLLNRKRAGAEKTSEDTPLPKAWATVMRRTAADNAHFARYLAGLGFVAAEYDNVAQGHEPPQEAVLERYLHTPFVFVTTTRKCPPGALAAAGDTVPVSGCRAQCGNFLLELESDAYMVRLLQTGNTQFYRNPLGQDVPEGFARIIQHQTIPR